MTSRVLAVTFGIIAALAAAAIFWFRWGETVALLPVGPADTIAALSLRGNRLACAITGTAIAFVIVAMPTALVGGIFETGMARRRIAALREDPANEDRANENRAHENRAIAPAAGLDTILAGTSVAAGGTVDAIPALLALENAWLERLTLRRLTAPLATLVLAADGVLALFGDIAGTGWNIALAAGLLGWLAIGLARYLASILLGPLVGRAVAAVARMPRPAAMPRPETPAATTPFDSGVIARALADLLAEPLERLADAADRLGSAEPATFHEQSVDMALAEIRQGIERLLAGSASR